MSNTIGSIIRLSSYGESHGTGVGAVLEGIPAGISIDKEAIQRDLDKRKPSTSIHSTQRKESDVLQIQSGVFEGKTTAAPIGLWIPNEDNRSSDYETLRDKYRPGHADYTYKNKYKNVDHRGGGRSSIRVWAPIVAAGSICRQYLVTQFDIELHSFVYQIGSVAESPAVLKQYTDWQKTAYNSELRTPHTDIEVKMSDHIHTVSAEGDTLGGAIHTSIRGLPLGIGEPIFDKLQAKLGQYLFSINTVKALEFGEGKKAASMKGSEHNDLQEVQDNQISFKSNHSGGILGGISTGEEICINTFFKPISSHRQSQEILSQSGEKVVMKIQGRHDVCAVPRAIPIIDAMCFLAIADLYRLGI